MAKPLAPIVHGPITVASTHVQVSGALPGAEVALLANGAEVGRETAVYPGTLWVPLFASLQAGQQITAMQSNAGGASAPTLIAVLVADVPDPLPAPVFDSPLSPCMSHVRLDALLPGARVRITLNGQVIADQTAVQSSEWLALDSGVSLPPGKFFLAWQEVTLGPHVISSPTVSSVLIPPFGPDTEVLPPPGITQPLVACATSLDFFNMTPAAAVIIENEGQTAEWTNVGTAYHAWGGPPLREGQLTARQVFRRCDRESETAVFQVHKPAAPPEPVVPKGYCPDLKRLIVSGLTAGAILHVNVLIPQGGDAWTQLTLGELGIGGASQTIDLPPDFPPPSPNGPVVLEIYQILCGIQSPLARVPVVAPGGPYAAPGIRGDLFDCARHVIVQGAHPGSLIQIFSDRGERSDAVTAPASRLVIRLRTPLVEGEQVYVRASGCNADGVSKPDIQVQGLPATLPRPQIEDPVRPSATSLVVDNILPGATVHVLVNWVVRSSVEVLEKRVALPLSGRPLVDGDLVFAVQTLCDRASVPEGPAVTVSKGHMVLHVSPTKVERGSAVPVTVSAEDADTGEAIVGAQVLLNGVPVGRTGQPFAYAPQAGQPNPAGLVREPLAHFDEPFSLTLTDPPVKSLGILRLVARPEVLALALKVTDVNWTITPKWGAPMLALRGATASGPLPDAPPPSGQFTVKGKVTAVADGAVNGVVFSNHTVTADIPELTFVWEGRDLGLGWAVWWRMEVDDDSGLADIVLSPTYVGPL